MNKLKLKLKKMFDFIFPKNIKCIFCGEELKKDSPYLICDDCYKNLPFNNQKICLKCGTKIVDSSDICNFCYEKLPPYKIARAPFIYSGKIRYAINIFKFDNAKYLFEPLSYFMIKTYKKFNYDCDIIIPMPLSKSHIKKRKYNQAEELAKPIGKALNLPIVKDSVLRIKNTTPQARLNHTERYNNLKNAFKLINKSLIKNKNILVIDDVMTTGATINSLCNVLQKAKPKNIYVLTLAHTYLSK